MVAIMKLHPSTRALLDEIDAFRERNGLTETAFGLDFSNDGKLVSDIRNKGRNPSPFTVDRLRAYMRRRREKVSAS